MERSFGNIPKMLEELMGKSDKLIREAARVPPQEKEWFMLIKEMAQRIADGGLPQGQSGSMGKSSNDFSEFSPSTIPDYLTFTKGKVEKYGTRVSFFPLHERDHLHRKKTNTRKTENVSSDDVNTENSRPSSRKASARGKKNSRQRVENDSDDCMIVGEAKPTSELYSGLDRTLVKSDSTDKFVTPVRKSKGPPPSSLRGKRRSGRVSGQVSKTLSLEQEIFQKKIKAIPAHSLEPHLVIRSSRFSMGKKKYSGLREAHQSSALGSRGSSKTSVAGKKEALQCKEDAAAENLKKIKDARRKKIEENKKIRDEKMERTKEKRLKLEKAKTLSSKQKTTETVTRSTRAQEKSMETRTRSREPKGGSGPETIAKTSQANSKKTAQSESEKPTPPVSSTKSRGPTPPSKTPLPKETPASTKSRGPTPPSKTPLPKETPASTKSRGPTPPSKTPLLKETPASSKNGGRSPPFKTPLPKETPASSKNGGRSPPLKTPLPRGTQASVKGRRPTPPLKTQPLKLTPTIVSLQNTTVTISKETEIKNSLKRAISPTSPPAAKGILKLKEEITSTSGPKLDESSSPHLSKKTKLDQTANTPKAGPSAKNKRPDSYELTPDRSSFTSYDMSEIVSDDDEETSGTQKPIPSWAVGLHLRNALLHQYYHPVDTDELFGNVCEVPDLEQMFDTKKKTYGKRTSSAVWQSPRAFR